MAVFKAESVELDNQSGLPSPELRRPSISDASRSSRSCLSRYLFDVLAPRTSRPSGGFQGQNISLDISHGPFPLLRTVLRHRLWTIRRSAFQAAPSGTKGHWFRSQACLSLVEAP